MMSWRGWAKSLYPWARNPTIDCPTQDILELEKQCSGCCPPTNLENTWPKILSRLYTQFTFNMEDSLDQLQARHRREQKDLQARITNKKKNATKKTRKGVNEECAELERLLKDRQEEELLKFNAVGGALDGGYPRAEAELKAVAGAGKEEDGVDKTRDASAKATATKSNGHSEEDRTDSDSLLATKLQDVSLVDGPKGRDQQDHGNATEETAGGGGGGGAGKKRNRQKERQARRAAEQEAAAVAAETEARDMVDHRGIEKAYMLREFKANALREKDIEPDGHCLFSAVADQLAVNGIALSSSETASAAVAAAGEEKERERMMPYRVVRRKAAEYMERHAEDFEGFLEEPLQSYVAKIRDTAEWGGQLELSALANAYRVAIKVVQDGRTEVVRPLGEEEGEEELKTLWLAYYRHGYGLGEHYNSLRKAS
jgi:OTU domain-containing protein 6